MSNKTRKAHLAGGPDDVANHRWCVGRISCGDEQSRSPPCRTAASPQPRPGRMSCEDQMSSSSAHRCPSAYPCRRGSMRTALTTMRTATATATATKQRQRHACSESSSTGSAAVKLTLTIKDLDQNLTGSSWVEIYLEDDYQEPGSIAKEDVVFEVQGTNPADWRSALEPDLEYHLRCRRR